VRAVAASYVKSLKLALRRNQTPSHVTPKIGIIDYVGGLNKHANFHCSRLDQDVKYYDSAIVFF
jgi:hypothetical protein